MSQFRAGIDISKDTYNIIKGNTSGIFIGSNTSTVNINSSKLNISSSNISIVSNYDGVEFSNNPIITISSIDPAENSRHIPTTEWVNNYFDTKFKALNLQLNANVVPYGVNLLELKRIPFQTLPSSITPVLPDKTTRVSLLVLGPGGSAGLNVSSLDSTNVSFGIGGAGGGGGAIFYPSIHCNFSMPFNINFSYSSDENNIHTPLATIISYSDELLRSTNVSLRNKVLAISNSGSKGSDTTYDTPGTQGTPGSGVIFYTYGQSVCQPGSLNISGNGSVYTGLLNASKTLTNFGGNNLLSYEIDKNIIDNVGGSQSITYNASVPTTLQISTIEPGKGAVYMWCWSDSGALQLNSSNTFNVSNGLGTQYNRLNNESEIISYRDTLTGPEKIFSITNVSKNCSIMYIDNIESKPIDFYTTGGYNFNASITNMSIFPENSKPIKFSIGENSTVINNSENTIQLGNESVVTRAYQLNSLDSSKKLMIGNLQSTGGISIGTETSIPNTVLISATSTALDKMEINSSTLNINVSRVSLKSGGHEILASDQTGNITIGMADPGKKIIARSIIETNSNIIMGADSSISIGNVFITNTGGTVSQNNNDVLATRIKVTGGSERFITLFDDINSSVFIVDKFGDIVSNSINISNGGTSKASISLGGVMTGTSATINGPINVTNAGSTTAFISSLGLITATTINVSNNGTNKASISQAGEISVTSINVSNSGTSKATISETGVINGTSINFGIGTTINASISSAGVITGTSINVSNAGSTHATISPAGLITGTSINVSNGGISSASISSTGDINGKSIVFSSGGSINASISSDGIISGTNANISGSLFIKRQGTTTATISETGLINVTSINVSNNGTNKASISETGSINVTSINVSNNGTNKASISETGSINVTSINVSNGTVNTASITSAGAITGTSATVSGNIFSTGNISTTSGSITSAGVITGTSATVSGNIFSTGNISTTSGSITSAGVITGTSANINGPLSVKISGTNILTIGSDGIINGNNNLFINGDIATTGTGSLSIAKNITAQSATITGVVNVKSFGGTGGTINADENITSSKNLIADVDIKAGGIVYAPRFESTSPTTNMVIGNLQTSGGILLGSGVVSANTVALNANTPNLNKMQINASNMSINTDAAVFKVLNSLGLTANSNNILTLDTSGNTTLGNASNVTMINSTLCLFNTSTLSLNSNGLNTIFSDVYGNVTVGNSVGTTNIMSLKQINFNTPLVTFNTPTTNSTPKGNCIVNSGIVSYTNYLSPGVIIYCGENSCRNTTDFAQDPFCICSPSGGKNVSEISSGGLSLGMGVDTDGRFGYINCAEFGTHRDIYLSSRGNASVYIGNPTSQVGSITSNLFVNGQTTITGNTVCLGTVSAGSDMKLKKDIVTVENALDKVKGLRGVNFTYIEKEIKSMGVIAQEIQEIIPEVVTDNSGTLTVNYGALSGLFIEAIKEMSIKHENSIKELKEKISILEKIKLD